MTPGDASKKIPAGIRAALNSARRAVLESAHFGAELIAANAPVDRGSLKSSVHVEKSAVGGAGTDVRIRIDAPHAAVMEMGSRPHTPPLGPLVEWVKRYRASFDIEGRGVVRDASGRFQASPAVVAVARAIQRKIARDGTKPTYFVQRQLPAIREHLHAALTAALKGR